MHRDNFMCSIVKLLTILYRTVCLAMARQQTTEKREHGRTTDPYAIFHAYVSKHESDNTLMFSENKKEQTFA